MTTRKYSKIQATPLRGGMITTREPALLKFGQFSQVQNLRPERPGFRKRPGQAKLHTTADSTNGVLSIYQFKKQKVTEQHLYAQMSDSDVLEATSNPPTVTTGAFGSEVFDGTASPRPASWGTVQDQLLFANGVDSLQIYGGNSSYVHRAVVYKGTSAAPDIPEEGFDYSDQVQTNSTSKTVVLNSLGGNANNFLAVMVPVQAKSFTIDVVNTNSNSVTLSNIEYGKNDNTWANVSGLDDGTEDDSKTLAQDGTIAFTAPTDMQPRLMFGGVGYWYRFKFSGALDSTVSINTITYDCDWQDVVNVWDGSTIDPIEVWTAFSAADEWSRYGASSVDLSELPDGRKIWLFCTDPIEAIYIDAGSTPNTGGATLSSVKYHDGDSFTSVGTVTDGTSGMKNSGWITFPRQSDVEPVQLESSVWYSYVYELIFGGAALTTDMNVGFTVRPYFDIDELGDGLACASFKSRMAYSFTRYPSLVFITPQYNPQSLNGYEYYVLEVGDGRQNPAVAMGRFYNELLVWQEEHGKEGGCTTLIQGYSSNTFGKLVLSDRIGIMNSKAWDIVDGVTISTATDESIRTVAVWLSRYGVCMTDGQTIWIISDDIQNYFDPTDSNSIRQGYADKNWVAYDSAYQLLRVGLVTGSTATVPNTFLAFDMVDKMWYEDSLGQELLYVTEVEAASGDIYTLQVGGGTDDGTIYLLNTGNDDVSTAIDSQLTIELSGKGELLHLEEVALRCKVQSSGNVKLTVTADGVTKVDDHELSMEAEVSGQDIRRHRKNLNVRGSQLSVRLRNNDASTDAYLYDLGVKSRIWEGR